MSATEVTSQNGKRFCWMSYSSFTKTTPRNPKGKYKSFVIKGSILLSSQICIELLDKKWNSPMAKLAQSQV